MSLIKLATARPSSYYYASDRNSTAMLKCLNSETVKPRVVVKNGLKNSLNFNVNSPNSVHINCLLLGKIGLERLGTGQDIVNSI